VNPTHASATVRPLLITSREQVHRHVLRYRKESKRVGVVMTMGALHEGHLSLVRRSVEECDVTVVTIFVNPAQFGQGEDLNKYPRQLTRDLEALQELPVDLVFAPDEAEMYREGHSTYVTPPKVATLLEGICRPGHFRGVATIVLKLLQVIPADVAYFGLKDYQQYLVVKTMVADLDVPTEIRACPIVREADGLAKSSRNTYLGPDERAQARALFRSLELAQQLVHDGVRHAAEITTRMRETLHAAGIERIDYVAIVDPETLEELRNVDRRSIALVAAYVGNTRLFDNRPLNVR
jgi:pantoate--beta-alanine ligase